MTPEPTIQEVVELLRKDRERLLKELAETDKALNELYSIFPELEL